MPAQRSHVAIVEERSDAVPLPDAGSIVPGGRAGRKVAREEQRRRRRRRLALVTALVVLLAGAGTEVWSLLSGSSDKSADGGSGATGRTQTTMLVQVVDGSGRALESALVAHDTATKQGAMLLVPSQVMADIPGLGSMPFGNAVLLGGLDSSKATLADLIGVTVDGVWVLDQHSLGKLVDAVGGVDVDVDTDVTQTSGGVTTIVVRKGQQHLDGAHAVQYAGFRAAGEVEQQRLARFDAVWEAMIQALPQQASAVAAQLGALGAGSKSTVPAARLAAVLTGLAADWASESLHAQQLPVTTIDTGGSDVAYGLDIKATRQFVEANLAASVPANRKGKNNVVMVENLVGTPGIGATTRDKLDRAGFVYRTGPNAAGFPNPHAPSVVLIYSDSAEAISQGEQVAKALGLPTSDLRHATDNQSLADVVVIIGNDYKP